MQAASGGARVGAVACPGLPNDFRVKGGDGHGQLGSVRDHFWGKYIFVRRAVGASCAGRLLYEVQAPCGSPRTRPRTPKPPHPGNKWGRRGPRHSETSRPGDPSDCNVFNWPVDCSFWFSSLFSRHMACCVQLSMAEREKTSVSQVTSLDYDRLQASLQLSFGTALVTSSPIHLSDFSSCCLCR